MEILQRGFERISETIFATIKIRWCGQCNSSDQVFYRKWLHQIFRRSSAYIAPHPVKIESVVRIWYSSLQVFLSDPSPIIGYACQWLPNWLTDSLTHSCLVDLVAVNDTNCLMMLQHLLKVFLRRKKLCKMVGILLNHKFLGVGQMLISLPRFHSPNPRH